MKDIVREWTKESPMYEKIANKQEVFWENDKYLPFEMTDAVCQLVVSDEDIREAEACLKRFEPYIKRCFAETAEEGGRIESPLWEIPSMQDALEKNCEVKIPGKLLLKMDSHLKIAGSVKARGGIYEVLKHAEDLVTKAGLLTKADNYERFMEEDIKAFLRRYTIQVGSTGNLGLSIGIMSAQLGFKVRVHMSSDARQWKKELLRSKGVEVIEYVEDYSQAVANGRKESERDAFSYFVDDEYSLPLFLGYAVAAGRLAEQLEKMKITVDALHPLFVYIPCGVGSAPGGICYGLKRIFKDCVHVFFCEPVKYPSVLLGMATGLYDKADVKDFGLGGVSAADGLACASPSGLVTRLDRNLVAGDFTVRDEVLFDYLRMLKGAENIYIEPSSCAAFHGVVQFSKNADGQEFLQKQGFTAEKLSGATQICWATGGMLVPEEEWEKYRKM